MLSHTAFFYCRDKHLIFIIIYSSKSGFVSVHTFIDKHGISRDFGKTITNIYYKVSYFKKE